MFKNSYQSGFLSILYSIGYVVEYILERYARLCGALSPLFGSEVCFCAPNPVFVHVCRRAFHAHSIALVFSAF
jgi:hypothetical protein